MALTPIRRVVTGNDERGRSKVFWDGPSPGTHEANFKGRGHTDFWVWRETPPPLDGTEDAGKWHDEFPCPPGGGHLRVVHWLAKTAESPPSEPYKAPETHGRPTFRSTTIEPGEAKGVRPPAMEMACMTSVGRPTTKSPGLFTFPVTKIL